MIRPGVDLISGVWEGHYEQVGKKFPQKMRQCQNRIFRDSLFEFGDCPSADGSVVHRNDLSVDSLL
jgi:hypothetical protein